MGVQETSLFFHLEGASLVTQLVKNPPAIRETPVQFLGQEDLLEERLPTPVFLGFPSGSDSKESVCDMGDLGWIPELGRSPGEVKGYPLQYSDLEKPHGHQSLKGYSPWGHKELDKTEQLSLSLSNLL